MDDSRQGLRLDRRSLLGLGATTAAVLAGTRLPRAWAAAPEDGLRVTQPFTLGVASGEPTPDGVVLWTRLAPDPLAGGGMPRRRAIVRWEVAVDEAFRRVVRRGAAVATPDLGHSVHVEVAGLQPARWYWYRFRSERDVSPVGRTRTAPAPGAAVDRLAFAFTSCQNYAAGYYTALAHMAEEDLDLVVQLGDYIYEGGPNPNAVRLHEGDGEPVSLLDYRDRHAQYKTDPSLQAVHGAFPCLVTFDDHEIDNNWADEIPQDPARQPRDAFLARRAAAFQAYYEHMPLRRSSLPRGIDIQVYRRSGFGALVDFHVLDTRQYRSDQVACPAGPLDCPPRVDPARTILGDEQERWLRAGLAGSTARWNVLAQQVFFSQRDFAEGAPLGLSTDAWDGYVADRDALRDFFVTAGVANPVVLTGDVHKNYVADIKADFADPDSATVGTELVGTSITSGGDGQDLPPDGVTQLAENPHIRFANWNRGYVRNVVTSDAWTADLRTVPYVTVPGAPVSTRASFVVESGRPGAQQVAGAPPGQG